MNTALTADQIIAKHHPNVRARARLELRIVDKLIEVAAGTGHVLEVDEYEDLGETGYDVRSALFNLDESRVTIRTAGGKYVGWVYLVFGNDGYDLISDYTLGAETFLAPVLAVADSLERTGS